MLANLVRVNIQKNSPIAKALQNLPLDLDIVHIGTEANVSIKCQNGLTAFQRMDVDRLYAQHSVNYDFVGCSHDEQRRVFNRAIKDAQYRKSQNASDATI